MILNVGEMKALEIHHLVTTVIVIIYSDRKNQWVLNQQGDIFSLKVFLHIMLFKEKK